DGVRYPAMFHRRDGLAENKAPGSMAYVENDPSLACFKQIRKNIAFLVQHRDSTEIHVSRDIAWTKMLQNQLLIRPLGCKASKVHHYRHAGQLSGFHGTIIWVPLGTCIVSRFDAHKDFRVLLDSHSRKFWVHVR